MNLAHTHKSLSGESNIVTYVAWLQNTASPHTRFIEQIKSVGTLQLSISTQVQTHDHSQISRLGCTLVLSLYSSKSTDNFVYLPVHVSTPYYIRIIQTGKILAVCMSTGYSEILWIGQ